MWLDCHVGNMAGTDRECWFIADWTAAARARYIAFAHHSERTQQTMFTVLVVATPAAGVVRSGAVHRFPAPLAGASISPLSLPRHLQAPDRRRLRHARWMTHAVHAGADDA